jgi:hypothetical protein
VYIGHQTDVVNGQMNLVPIISTYKGYEAKKHAMLTNQPLSPYTFMNLSALWDELCEEEPAIVRLAANSCVVAGLQELLRHLTLVWQGSPTIFRYPHRSCGSQLDNGLIHKMKFAQPEYFKLHPKKG